MTERIQWTPSNCSDHNTVDPVCAGCKHGEEPCKIYERAMIGADVPEWTANDCYGRGFECSGFKRRFSPPLTEAEREALEHAAAKLTDLGPGTCHHCQSANKLLREWLA